MVNSGTIYAFSCILAAGILILLEVGRRIGVRRAGKYGTPGSTGVVDASVFGLMSLLLAFTFSGAASRWEWRRNQVVEEANAIGTAYRRLDLLPSIYQPELREDFRRYVSARLTVYQKLPDVDAAYAELHRSESIQNEIWRQAVAGVLDQRDPAVTSLVISSLNAMFDITTARTAATRTHLPFVVFVMLGITVLTASLLAGYAMAGEERRTWVHWISFMILVSIAVYLILELEYPRIGLVQITGADELLMQELERMK